MAKKLTSLVRSAGLQFGAGEQNLLEFYGVSQGTVNACAAFSQYTNWCVPPGITKATFHIWGAGGIAGGYGGLTNAYSPPSSSGAYAAKTINVTAGDCYTLHIGAAYCAVPCRNGADKQTAESLADDFFDTFVTGNGLTNFCAEGGNHSCAINDTPANIWTDSASIVWNDSENAPQAKYYGADKGHDGVNGYFKWTNNALSNSNCNVRWYIPMPACVLTKHGGHFVQQSCCTSYASYNNGQSSAAMGAPGHSNTWYPNALRPGNGARGTASSGGTATCGSTNGAGKIEVYFS